MSRMWKQRIRDELESWINPWYEPLEPVATLNFHEKLAVLKAASSVVGLKSFIGERELFKCSGIVVESERAEGSTRERYVNYVVTVSRLVACPSDVVTLPSDITVKIYLPNGRRCGGKISGSAIDFHYNVAIIKMISDAPLPVVVWRHLDVSVPMCIESQGDSNPPLVHFDFQADKREKDGWCSLRPGDQVIALARNFSDLNYVAGKFSVDPCRLDIQELLMTSCKTNEVFNGGPLVNCNGEVLGINFCQSGYTMFLPTNMVWRCFKNLQKNELVRRPWHGIKFTDLYAADVDILDKAFLKLPNIRGGVLVKTVCNDSSAKRAGLIPMDIICQCNGSTVNCSVKFSEMMWDNAGESVELVVKRVDGRNLRLTMIIEEATRDKYDRWLLDADVRRL